MSARRDDEGRQTSPPIDEGFRRWYEACPCCLGKAYPEIRRILDEEGRGADASEAQASAHAPNISERRRTR